MAYHRVTSGVRCEGADLGSAQRLHRPAAYSPGPGLGRGLLVATGGQAGSGGAGRSGLRLGGVGLGVELSVEGVAQVGEGGAKAGRGNGRVEGVALVGV